jgi:chemotaxis protein methyltransferase CheR
VNDITPQELSFIADYVKRVTGIHLDQSKKYLIESRFKPLMRELNLNSFAEFNTRLSRDPALQKRVIDAITTRETYFFRDNGPFELLRHKLFPEMINKKLRSAAGMRPSIRIWSAACSTGQEVYSIAIILRELITNIEAWDVRILGTDISDAAIQKASYAKYSRLEVERGLPPQVLSRWFTPEGDLFKVRDDVRFMATFQKGNLLEPFNHLGKFDLILCRNVAIYFTHQDKMLLFERIATQLNPGGFLIVGASESLTLYTQRFTMKQANNSVYYEVNL